MDSMASTPINEDNNNKGNMWVLEQKLDQPMDDEGGRIKNMYRQKVRSYLFMF